MDLTTVPTGSGFWIPWLPFALVQRWPFCWWVALIIDHFSRKCMGLAVYPKQPTSVQVRAFLGRVMHAAHAQPRHMISDKGSQFFCDSFKKWAKRRKIKPRYGAVGKYGSIAVIERFIRSLKHEHTRRILVPLRAVEFRTALSWYVEWHNGQRPHQSLDGKTPDDVYSGAARDSPILVVRGKNAVQLQLHVSPHRGQTHLPIVELRKVA